MELKFKPLTKGLGFQHLPEPAEPPAEPPRGARVAGPPVFVTSFPKPTKAAVSTQSVAPTPLLLKDTQNTKDFAYLLRRLGAFLTDTTINFACLTFGAVFAASRSGTRILDFVSWELGLVVLLLFFVISWIVVGIQDTVFRTSLGKRVFDLNLPGSRVAIFLRNFFFPISLAPLGLGLFWALWDSKRRTWHDMIVELQPERLTH